MRVADELTRGLSPSNETSNWKYYDEKFRFLRQAQQASYPWGVIHWKLRMRAQHSLNKHTNPAGQGHPKQQDQVTPKGYCFKFHRG